MSTTQNITPNQARELIKNENVIILDVRAPGEYDGGHIENAKNLDFTDPDFSQNLEKLDKNKKYLVYCKTGRRGDMAMKAMEEAGFNEVYNLIGGYEIWEKE